MRQQALRPHLATYGAGQPRTARAELGLGTVELALGHFERAETAFRQADHAFSVLLPEFHPERLNASIRLATLASRLGRHREAERLFEHAESPLREQLGRHPNLADLLRLKSVLLLDQYRPVEAEKAAAEALDIFVELVGERHLDSADTLQKLAHAVAEQPGRLEEGRALMAKALEIFESLTGPDSPRTAEVLADSGWLSRLARDFDLSHRQMTEALAALRQFYGGRHPDLATLHTNLGNVELIRAVRDGAENGGVEDLEGAEKHYRTSLEIARATMGEEAPFFGALLTNLARLLVRMDRPREAEQALERIVEIFDGADMEAEHFWRLHADRVWAQLGLKRGEHQAIDDLLKPWLERLAAATEDGDQSATAGELAYTVRLAANNFEAWGRPDEAARLRSRFGFN